MDRATEGRVKDCAEQSTLGYAEVVVVVFGRLELEDGVSRIYLRKAEADEAPHRRNSDPAVPDGLHILRPPIPDQAGPSSKGSSQVTGFRLFEPFLAFGMRSPLGLMPA